MVNGVEEDGELPGQAARLHLEHPRLGEGMLTWGLRLSLGFDTMSWAEWLGLCGQHCVLGMQRKREGQVVSCKSPEQFGSPTLTPPSSSVIGE